MAINKIFILSKGINNSHYNKISWSKIQEHYPVLYESVVAKAASRANCLFLPLFQIKYIPQLDFIVTLDVQLLE